MQFTDKFNEKIMVSIVDDIIDDSAKDYLLEIKIKRCFFDQIFFASKNNLVVEVHSDGLLTSREVEVLRYLAQGKNNYQIAQKLNVSVHTAKAHIQNIFKKLCVTDRTEAVVKAIKERLIYI